MFKDREMLDTTARLSPLQERANCPENDQGKKLNLREVLGGEAEVENMTVGTKGIPGADDLVVPLGKKPSCYD